MKQLEYLNEGFVSFRLKVDEFVDALVVSDECFLDFLLYHVR